MAVSSPHLLSCLSVFFTLFDVCAMFNTPCGAWHWSIEVLGVSCCKRFLMCSALSLFLSIPLRQDRTELYPHSGLLEYFDGPQWTMCT
jgi:hypothetical protein